MRIDLRTPEVHDMTDDTVEVVSTSSVTANASPIVLNQTDMLRLNFCQHWSKTKKSLTNLYQGKFFTKRNVKVEMLFRVMVMLLLKEFPEAL